MSCQCDQHRCSTPFVIPAALPVIPRAPGTFPDWRVDLLAAIGREPALDQWRAREPGDLGMMLAEMCAYVLDVASFYDQLIVNESYLLTARLAGAQRRHIALLGYLPRPAVGASVWLAAEADGTRVVTLPAGTAVRSAAFDGNPPQVFEFGAAFAVEPRVNRMEIERVKTTLLPSPLTGVPVAAGSAHVRGGEPLVLDMAGTLAATHAAGLSALLLRIRKPVTHIGFTSSITPPAGATYATTRLLKPGARSGTWKLTPGSGEPAVLTSTDLSLERRIDLHPGDVVAISDGTTLIACHVSAVSEVQYTLLGPLTSTITDADGNNSSLVSPAIQVGVTRITVDVTLPFTASSASQLTVYHAMGDAAILYPPPKDTLDQGDPISIPGLIDPPRVAVSDLMLEDVHGDGVVTGGTLDADAKTAATDAAPAWGRELWAPVGLYGNVAMATRGETVAREALGRGDSSLEFQTFRLKKKPLTYVSAANAAGRKSTLVIHVGGVAWQEVDSFYGVGAHDTVYVVRHDDDGNTDVEFGGGARLPTGAAVVADYRFGAGAAAPPADSVKQVTRPVAGLRKIHNVLPAFGGADAEGPSELTVRGPQSALLLGRAISLLDFETAAAQQSGVRAARAVWGWDELGLRPAVIVSYIGDPQLAPAILAVLRALAEDDAPITAQSATAQTAWLQVDIDVNEKFVTDDVVAAVSQALFAPVTLPGTGGLLRPERLGPDGVVFESVVVRAIMAVPGVAALRTITFDETPLLLGRRPPAGAYFDFESGGVWVNGKKAG